RCPVTAEVAGSSPVAPAFGTELTAPRLCGIQRLEIGHKRVVRLDGDDAAVLRPHLLKERREQLAPLRRLHLERPEAAEVFEQRTGTLDSMVDGRSAPLQLFLDRLAAHHVLRLR